MPPPSSPVDPARSRRLALFLLPALAIGCREPSVPTAPELRIVRRLLDERFRTAAPPFTRGGFETVAGVRKPIVTTVVPITPGTVCMPTTDSTSPNRPCTITVPRSEDAIAALIVETASLPLLRAAAKPRELRELLEAREHVDRRRRFVVRRQPLHEVPAARNVPFWTTTALRAYPVIGPGAWTFASHPTNIPTDAILTFAVGIQEPAWYVDSAPVQFTIDANTPEGSIEIYRRALDPARHPEDRRWFDENVSLAAWAGQTVILHFRVRPFSPHDRRPQLPLWADPTLLAPRAAPSPPMPGIVLVSLDTLRAKSMSVYGYAAHETTPWLSRFATGATRFAHAYTTFSNTYGAHISMLTGTYPGRHGVRGGAQRLAPDIPTLAEQLRAAGYDTAAFTEDALIDGRRGFERGFGHYWENEEIQAGTGDAPGTFDRALTWLAAHRDRPFFLFVHTYAVHSPYLPSPPYDSAFGDAEQVPTPADQLAYEREIRQLDDDLARLVAGIDALVSPDRLVLVITADHGEEFWEHGGFFHTHLYDEVLHVPLFFRGPGQVTAGRTLDEQVSLIDIAPTLLDLAGVDPGTLDGRTLRPLLEGTTATLGRETILAESPPNIFSQYAWKFVARQPGAKCFSYELASLDACFDLSLDPEERHPLPPTGAHAALWEAARVHGESVFTGAAPAETTPDLLEDDPERVRKLRALGYLQ